MSKLQFESKTEEKTEHVKLGLAWKLFSIKSFRRFLHLVVGFELYEIFSFNNEEKRENKDDETFSVVVTTSN